MTEQKAPERIWAKPGMPGYITDGPVHGIYDVEYVRADLHSALAAENERLKRDMFYKDALLDAYAEADAPLAKDVLKKRWAERRAALEEGKDG